MEFYLPELANFFCDCEDNLLLLEEADFCSLWNNVRFFISWEETMTTCKFAWRDEQDKSAHKKGKSLIFIKKATSLSSKCRNAIPCLA